MIHFRGHSPKKFTDEISYHPVKKTAKHTTTLNDLDIAEMACITHFYNEDDTVKKIEAMGLRCGEEVSVIHKLGRGIIVKTNNSRIVITKDVAKFVEVK